MSVSVSFCITGTNKNNLGERKFIWGSQVHKSQSINSQLRSSGPMLRQNILGEGPNRGKFLSLWQGQKTGGLGDTNGHGEDARFQDTSTLTHWVVTAQLPPVHLNSDGLIRLQLS